MDFFITLALILGLFIVPGLINYYVNRYFTPPGTSSAPTSELVTASLTLTFAILVLDVAAVLLIALGWDDLRDDIADFVQMGLLDFARDRPIAASASARSLGSTLSSSNWTSGQTSRRRRASTL